MSGYFETHHNIKMDVVEIGRGVVGWVGLTQYRDKWSVLVKEVIGLRVA
jgi:hypothetical protein